MKRLLSIAKLGLLVLGAPGALAQGVGSFELVPQVGYQYGGPRSYGPSIVLSAPSDGDVHINVAPVHGGSVAYNVRPSYAIECSH